MKNLLQFSLAALVLFLFANAPLHAQTEGKANTAVVKIKTSAECEMCKTRIEKEVGMMKGVKKATLDLQTKVLTVEYNPKKTSPEKIRAVISNLGYDADDVKANNRATKQLPHCCQPKDSVK